MSLEDQPISISLHYFTVHLQGSLPLACPDAEVYTMSLVYSLASNFHEGLGPSWSHIAPFQSFAYCPYKWMEFAGPITQVCLRPSKNELMENRTQLWPVRGMTLQTRELLSQGRTSRRDWQIGLGKISLATVGPANECVGKQSCRGLPKTQGKPGEGRRRKEDGEKSTDRLHNTDPIKATFGKYLDTGSETSFPISSSTVCLPSSE